MPRAVRGVSRAVCSTTFASRLQSINNLFLKYYKRWDLPAYKRSVCTNNVDNPSMGTALQAIETQIDQMSWACYPRAMT